jgi:serine/threonine protein phosphatase 1
MSPACNMGRPGRAARNGCGHVEEKTTRRMLKRLFQRPRATAPTEPTVDGRAPRLPRGVRVYAIGDLHGRLDLLLTMEKLIEADRREHGPHDDALIVHLGDLVDRGFDSRKLLDHLVATAAIGPPKVILLGNHDLWLREFVAADRVDPEQAASWMRYGGDATLLSYGVKLDLRQPEAERFAAAQRQIRDRFPAKHFELLDGLDLAFGFGDYFFCHAGIRPELALERQSEADLLWIREPFLSWDGSHGKIVVHGHTVEEAPVTRVNRIGIDTGACWTGLLTCLALSGQERRFLQTGR